MLELWLQLSFLVDFYQGIIKMQMTPSASLQNFYTILFLGFVVPNFLVLLFLMLYLGLHC